MVFLNLKEKRDCLRGAMERTKTEREGLPSPLSPTPGSSSRLIEILFNRRTRDTWGQVSATSGHSTACHIGAIPHLIEANIQLKLLPSHVYSYS